MQHTHKVRMVHSHMPLNDGDGSSVDFVTVQTSYGTLMMLYDIVSRASTHLGFSGIASCFKATNLYSMFL